VRVEGTEVDLCIEWRKWVSCVWISESEGEFGVEWKDRR